MKHDSEQMRKSLVDVAVAFSRQQSVDFLALADLGMYGLATVAEDERAEVVRTAISDVRAKGLPVGRAHFLRVMEQRL